MDVPIKELKAIEQWLEAGRQDIAGGRWEKAEAAIREALALDENHPGTYDLMATLFEAQGNEPMAAQWRERARQVRKDAWTRQVEAEARGHHEMLGEPGRHEIP